MRSGAKSMSLDPMNESLRVRKPDAMDRLVQQESPLLYGFIFRLVKSVEDMWQILGMNATTTIADF